MKPLGYIPPDAVFVLRWQSSPTHVKYTCNATDSTYILYACFIKMRYNYSGSIFHDYARFFQFYLLGSGNIIFNVPNATSQECVIMVMS